MANMFSSKFRNCITDCKDGVVCGLEMGGDFNIDGGQYMVHGIPSV